MGSYLFYQACSLRGIWEWEGEIRDRGAEGDGRRGGEGMEGKGEGARTRFLFNDDQILIFCGCYWN